MSELRRFLALPGVDISWYSKFGMGGLRGFDLGFYLLAEGGGDVDEGVEEESADAFAKEIVELWLGNFAVLDGFGLLPSLPDQER
jgi:hypothetical protein